MNSNTVKPEKFGHLHLVYHFAVPLSSPGSVKNLAILSDTTVRGSTVHQEYLKPYWKPEKRSRFFR